MNSAHIPLVFPHSDSGDYPQKEKPLYLQNRSLNIITFTGKTTKGPKHQAQR